MYKKNPLNYLKRDRPSLLEQKIKSVCKRVKQAILIIIVITKILVLFKKRSDKIINLSISFGKTTNFQNKIKTIYAELF